MEISIKKEGYDIHFTGNDDVIVMFDSINQELKGEEAEFNIRLRADGLTVKIIKDKESVILLEEFELPVAVAIEDKEDVVITELNEEGDVAETYLAKVIIGDK